MLVDIDSECPATLEQPEDYLDLDFHNSFGSFLTRKIPVSSDVDPAIARYWSMLHESPTLLQHNIHAIGHKYRDAFRDFFTAEPDQSSRSCFLCLQSLIAHKPDLSYHLKRLIQRAEKAS